MYLCVYREYKNKKIKLSFKNYSKYAETPRKTLKERGAMHAQRKGTVPKKRKNLVLFSAVTGGVKTPESYLVDVALANLSSRCSSFFYIRYDPRLKTPNKELVRITIKTPYNGLEYYN